MLSPKNYIAELVPAVHGGINYAGLPELGFSVEDLLDFSVNTNPFGPPPGIWESFSKASLDRYPDSDSIELRQVLSRKLGISIENLLIGSGSTELIRLVAAAYFGAGDKVLIPHPTYGEYEIASRLVNAGIIRLPLPEENGFQLDLSLLEKAIREHRPSGIFLCNPNNPTGQCLSCRDIENLLSLVPDSLVVLDEAYISFAVSDQSSIGLLDRPNLIVIRSLTKDYALAGLRLGYLLASAPVINTLNRIKPPWNVNAFAQAAGIAALQNAEYLQNCASHLREAGDFLTAGLRTLGWQPLPSQAHFFLVKVGDAPRLTRDLLSRGILVRDCSSFGLPQYIRLSPRSIPECQKLIQNLQQLGVNRYAG